MKTFSLVSAIRITKHGQSRVHDLFVKKNRLPGLRKGTPIYKKALAIMEGEKSYYVETGIIWGIDVNVIDKKVSFIPIR